MGDATPVRKKVAASKGLLRPVGRKSHRGMKIFRERLEEIQTETALKRHFVLDFPDSFSVCAVANSKLLPRIHQLLKKLKQAENSGTHRPYYVFRDLQGNPISKTEAKAIITAKWGHLKYGRKGLATA